MDLTTTAYGTWSGGRFMHFGQTLTEDHFIQCIQTAYQSGIRSFVTADVYGNGKADELLGQALVGIPRDSYALVGMIGHDFYQGQRQGSRGYPRFTDPALRRPAEFADFITMACEKSLQRCLTDHFDLLMLHNPDESGYTNIAVWNALSSLKSHNLTRQLGIAPGPANGFTLDLIDCLERFGEVIDWAMLILNPLEPWPTNLTLPACQTHNTRVLTRVVDHGGIFHGDLTRPDHTLHPGDHRAYRPDGWIADGLAKVANMEALRERHGLTLLQLAAIWNLSQAPVACVVPTFIQEYGPNARPIEDSIHELAALPDLRLSPEEVEAIRQWGDNTGCMQLKGASHRHQTHERPDEWPMRPDLVALAQRHGLGDAW